MRIRRDTIHDIAVLYVAEDISPSDHGALGAALDRACAEGCRHLLLDLHEVPFLDSAALGLLTLLSHQARQTSGHLRLVNPQAPVREILTRSTLSSIVPVHDSLEEALQAIGVRLTRF